MDNAMIPSLLLATTIAVSQTETQNGVAMSQVGEIDFQTRSGV